MINAYPHGSVYVAKRSDNVPMLPALSVKIPTACCGEDTDDFVTRTSKRIVIPGSCGEGVFRTTQCAREMKYDAEEITIMEGDNSFKDSLVLPRNKTLELYSDLVYHFACVGNTGGQWFRQALLVVVIAATMVFGITDPALSEESTTSNAISANTDHLNFMPPLGAALQARSGVILFSNSPSSFFGNLFNEKIRSLDEGEKFLVRDVLIYPGVGGNQIWLKITPSDNSECSNVSEECWALYGIQPEPDNQGGDWNFLANRGQN